MYVALQHSFANFRKQTKGQEMNKVISTLLLLTLTTPVVAEEYKTDDYTNYGYAAGASVIPSTHLKGGLRGAHVAANHHSENSYYPGYTAVPQTKK